MSVLTADDTGIEEQKMYWPTKFYRWMLPVLVIVLLAGTPSIGNADTLSDPPPSPYPDHALILTSYDQLEPNEFFTASGAGVWFLSPLGLNCGIWDRGSFGCAGDIRGAPPGTSHIGWINGNIVTRYDANDPLLRFQFPPARGEKTLPPHSYVTYNGTTCATMADTSTYCARGPFRFFITPTQTWLSPP
ncbi:hypothetical protein [Mycolicibacterium peregrinum]|uniref:hypothetical protein n=1 Tax=Mycolicibacterium peregrinum TaxID=43304 RepID=UPI0020B764B1|nr:hypothetical protein [Mycolicibacterium peregrinum]